MYVSAMHSYRIIISIVLLQGTRLFDRSPWSMAHSPTTTPTMPPTTTTKTPPTMPASGFTTKEVFEQTYGVDSTNVNTTQLVYGRSASWSKFEYGIFLETATWFDANATCEAEGYDNLLNMYDRRRMYWATKTYLRRLSSNFLDLYFWNGNIRLDPCSSDMYNNSCGREVDPLIPFNDFNVKEQQCAAISHRTTPQMNWKLCDELHPFICEKHLGEITYNNEGFSGIPVYMQDFYVNYNITINQFWNISDCEQRCTSNIFCMTFTYDHTTKRCWKYLHMRAEELFNIVPVAANVTTSVKEGYAVRTFNDTIIQQAVSAFVCPGGSIYNYTRNDSILCPVSSGNFLGSAPSTSPTISVVTASSQIILSPAVTSVTTPTLTSALDSPYPLMTSTSGSVSTFSPSHVSLIASGPESTSTHSLFPSFSVSSGSSVITATPGPSLIDVSTSIVSYATDSMSTETTTIDSSKTTVFDYSSTLSSFSLVLSSESPQQTTCKCPCTDLYNTATASETVDEIIKRLEIPKQNTGKYKRKLSCAGDDRPRSVQLGGLGLAVLVCTFASIVIFDLLRYLKRD